MKAHGASAAASRRLVEALQKATRLLRSESACSARRSELGVLWLLRASADGPLAIARPSSVQALPEMGTVLHAPPGLQPPFDEPFVIVDARLRLQAVSRRADAGCGLPPAAVLILTPLRTSSTRRSERAQRRPAVADRLTAETRFDPRGGTVTVELTMPPSASPG